MMGMNQQQKLPDHIADAEFHAGGIKFLLTAGALWSVRWAIEHGFIASVPVLVDGITMMNVQ